MDSEGDSQSLWEAFDISVKGRSMRRKFSLLLHHESSLYSPVDCEPVEVECESNSGNPLLSRFKDIEKVYPFGE